MNINGTQSYTKYAQSSTMFYCVTLWALCVTLCAKKQLHLKKIQRAQG
jgi:hypothetical protein